MKDDFLGTIRKTEDGRYLPLHLHPHATSATIVTDVEAQAGSQSPANAMHPLRDISCIYRTTYEDFRRLPDPVLREIFRHRHILITDCPQDHFEWTEESLGEILPIDAPLQVQGTAVYLSFVFGLLLISCRSQRS